MLAPGLGLPTAAPTVAVTQRGLTSCLPRPGQLLDQTGEMCTGEPGGGRMGQGRTGPLLGHTRRTRAGSFTPRPLTSRSWLAGGTGVLLRKEEGRNRGGIVAYLLAEEHPQRVSRMVLEDVPVPRPREPTTPTSSSVPRSQLSGHQESPMVVGRYRRIGSVSGTSQRYVFPTWTSLVRIPPACSRPCPGA